MHKLLMPYNLYEAYHDILFEYNCKSNKRANQLYAYYESKSNVIFWFRI